MKKGKAVRIVSVLAWFAMMTGCSAANLDQPCKVHYDSNGKDSAQQSVITMSTPPAYPTCLYWDKYSSGSSYPGMVSGTVSAGGDVWFALAGLPSAAGGQSLVITLGTLADSMVYLYLERTDPGTGAKTLTLIASDDDGGVGLASKLDFPFKYVRDYANSGSIGQYVRYLVRVTGYSSSQSGTFSLTRYVYDCDAVKNGGTAYPYNAGWDEVLPSWASGASLAQRGNIWYTLGMGSGNWNGGNWSVKTYITSPMTLPDSVLEIWDMAHYNVPTRIAINDDYGGTLASQISMYFPLVSTMSYPYLVKVRAYSKNQSGTFSFRVKNN